MTDATPQRFSRRFISTFGGHAPGSLREELMDAFDLPYSDQSAWWERLSGGKSRARRLCGLLWNCTDTVPELVCCEAGVPTGSSYAVLVRHLKRNLD